jgi:TorA maturation chaperone TorD
MGETPATRESFASAALGASPEPENRLRADTYRVLGSLLAAPPDDETLRLFAEAPVAEDGDLLAVAWRLLATSASRTTERQAADEFQSLFIGVGRGELMPYGSWYLTGYLMEQPLAKLRSDLMALGFERRDDVAEPEDHAAALCETMALLAEDGELASLQTQSEFFETHIAPWMARFFRDMQEAVSARFYRAVGQLGEQFIETDQRYLEMVERPEETPAEQNGSGLS